MRRAVALGRATGIPLIALLAVPVDEFHKMVAEG